MTAACFFGDVVSFVRRNAINALRLFVCSSVALAHLALPAMKSEFHGPITTILRDGIFMLHHIDTVFDDQSQGLVRVFSYHHFFDFFGRDDWRARRTARRFLREQN